MTEDEERAAWVAREKARVQAARKPAPVAVAPAVVVLPPVEADPLGKLFGGFEETPRGKAKKGKAVEAPPGVWRACAESEHGICLVEVLAQEPWATAGLAAPFEGASPTRITRCRCACGHGAGR